MIEQTTWQERKSVEETALRLQSEGFEVEFDVAVPTEAGRSLRFDLVARRNGDAIAFEFVPIHSLRMATPKFSQLRMLARQAGYSDLRVIVVSENATPQLQIDGFQENLLLCVQDFWERAEKEEWSHYSPQRLLEGSITTVRTTKDEEGARLMGQGAVHFVSKSDPEDTLDCALNFDLRVDGRWKILVGDPRNQINIILDIGK